MIYGLSLWLKRGEGAAPFFREPACRGRPLRRVRGDSMKLQRRSSLRTKILGVSMVASLLAVLAVMAAMSMRDYFMYNLSFRDQNNRLAQSLALTAAVSVTARPDEEGLQDAFSLMARSPGVVSVTLTTPEGAMISEFARPLDEIDDGPDMLFYAPVISSKGRVLGSVRLMARQAQPISLFVSHLIVATVVLAMATGTAYFLAQRIWPSLDEPLRDLRRAMRRIAEAKDYSSRLDYSGDAEIDQLIKAFNAMIAEIERRDLAYAAALADLASARDAAHRANRAKTQFLAVMSHELRTPLNAVIGYAELIQEELRHGAEAQDLIPDARRIRASANGLLELINGILEMSTAEGGRMSANWTPVDAADLARDVIDGLAPLAARKGNRVSIDVVSRPEGFVTDEARLRQCLVNLLGNAVKFTENGQVGLRVFLREGDSAAPRVIFDVGDTGPGMSPRQIEGLFQPFAQLDSSNARKHEGAGLGLAISRKLARFLGGDITVKSVVGVGSVFTIDLPLRPPSHAASGEAASAAGEPCPEAAALPPGEARDAA